MASHCVRVLFGRPWDLGNYAEKLVQTVILTSTAVPKMPDFKTATSMPYEGWAADPNPCGGPWLITSATIDRYPPAVSCKGS